MLINKLFKVKEGIPKIPNMLSALKARGLTWVWYGGGSEEGVTQGVFVGRWALIACTSSWHPPTHPPTNLPLLRRKTIDWLWPGQLAALVAKNLAGRWVNIWAPRFIWPPLITN